MSHDPAAHVTQNPSPEKDSDPAHAPHLDTTAQKPPNWHGPRKTGPAEDADQHHQFPIPGAWSPAITEGTEIGKSYTVAAGIPAVLQTARFALRDSGLFRGAKALLKVNQKDGFDCQSCAWPSPDEDRNVAEFCENGAKAVADEATTKRVTPEFFAAHSVADLLKETDFWLGQQGRLTHPMIKREGATHYQPIAWEEAFGLVAKELNSLASPDEAVFYTSGRATNETAFLFQLFARQFGTNNLPDCSNMCHESSGEALSESIGIGKGCVKLEDFNQADAIFIVGQNPGTNHPRMLTALAESKNSHHGRPGAKIVSINPLPEVGNFRFKNPQSMKNPVRGAEMLFGGGTELSDVWLPVRINGDMAVFKGIMKRMLEADDKLPGSVIDRAFIDAYTSGFEAFNTAVREESWEAILAGSGLTMEQIDEAADIAIASKRIIVCWAMGITQHKNSVATIQEIMNFLLIGGNIGREGAGPCPVRGHSNVQGDRTMGIWERMNDKFMEKLGEEFAFTPPAKHGFDTVETIKQMHAGFLKVFVSLGGNFLVATPDTENVAHALQQTQLTVQLSTKLNRSHLITGKTALILPVIGRSEHDVQKSGRQFMTVEDSMGIVNPSRGVFDPPSKDLLSEPAIISRLARETLGTRSTVAWEALVDNYDHIRDHIDHVIPGFENFNARIRQDIFYLPNEARDKRKFNNGTGKAKFVVTEIPEHILAKDQFVLMTIRSHDQFNTHIYGLDDRYRGIYNGRRVIFMHPADIQAKGFEGGQPVDITSHFGEDEKRAAKNFLVTPYDIPRGCVAVYYPEGNVLVPINSVADRSNCPTSKYVVVTLAPAADPGAAAAAILKDAASLRGGELSNTRKPWNQRQR